MDFPCTSYVTIAGIAKLCPKNHKAFLKMAVVENRSFEYFDAAESEFNDLCPW